MWRKQNGTASLRGAMRDIERAKKYTRDRQLPESLADSRQLSSDQRTGGLGLRQDEILKCWFFTINEKDV